MKCGKCGRVRVATGYKDSRGTDGHNVRFNCKPGCINHGKFVLIGDKAWENAQVWAAIVGVKIENVT